MPNTTPVTTRKKSGKSPLKPRTQTVQQKYGNFFVPAPSPYWQQDNEDFSLDQPSPYKWVQTETTYGIDVTLIPGSNA